MFLNEHAFQEDANDSAFSFFISFMIVSDNPLHFKWDHAQKGIMEGFTDTFHSYFMPNQPQWQ